MPAHVKSSMFGASVTVPITNGRLNLGTWQACGRPCCAASYPQPCVAWLRMAASNTGRYDSAQRRVERQVPKGSDAVISLNNCYPFVRMRMCDWDECE